MIITNNHNSNAVASFKKTTPLNHAGNSFNFSLTEVDRDQLLSAKTGDTFISTTGDYTNETATSDTYSNWVYNNVIDISRQSPYGAMANANGIINYNGVTYVYNSTDKYLDLGDMTDQDQVLRIPLSTGDTLRVNRDNIDQVAKSISMFTPADQKRIMDAIYTDAKCRGKKLEAEEFKKKVMDAILDKSHETNDSTYSARTYKKEKI